MEPLAIPVVVYAAKSTADEHDSVGSQVTDVREAVEREGDRRLVAEPFTETAVSG